MGDLSAVAWFRAVQALPAPGRCDAPRRTRGPRIGRGGSSKPPTLLRGPVADGVAVTVPLDPYLSLRALAGYSGLSVRKLRDLCNDPAHPLPCYRVGGKILVRRSEYDAWVARYRQVGDPDLDRIVSETLRGLKGAA
jgi:hypothetical protein